MKKTATQINPWRPLKWKTPEELEKLCDAYFDSCYEEQQRVTGSGRNKKVEMVKVQVEPFTICGLALALDLTRRGLLNYEDETSETRKPFFPIIKRAKLKCQQYAEKHTFGNNPTGAIFNLKCNYEWQDKTSLEISGGVDLAIFIGGKKVA
jgi:hypothetical protein